MATKVIIKQLRKAISQPNSQDAIDLYTGILSKNITKAANEPNFYSLPFDQISNIIKKAEFLNPNKVKEPLTVLQTLIQQTSEAYPTEAVLLLNVIKIDKLPPLLPDNIIPIIAKFTNCELLTKLGELHEYYEGDMHIFKPTPEEQENEELKEEITKLKQKIDELNNKIKELEEQNKYFQGKEIKFQPITEKPTDFEENVFDAVEKGKIDSVRYHFEVLHADIKSTCDRTILNHINCPGLTAVHIAAAYGQLPIVKYFYQFLNVDKEIRTEYEFTPLIMAAICGQLPIVQYLCEVAKVNTEAKDRYGEGAFYNACWKGHLSIVQYLCEVQKVNTEAKNKRGKTPLHIACFNNQLSVVQYLCEVAKVNTEAKDNEGRTALHLACEFGYLPVVQYLCEVTKVNTEAKDNEGRTPLHTACLHSKLPVVQYLCEVAKVNTEGAYARATQPEVKRYLKKYIKPKVIDKR